ncbi:MAG: hypothetical protein II949_12525 [Prevotella sp.]|nr:hypothetical protein [Prevotella sp.]
MKRKYISTQTNVYELLVTMDMLAGSAPTVKVYNDYEVNGDQVLTRHKNIWENDEDEDSI